MLNIYNSTYNRVEEFKQSYAGQYSQSQCAIVIERVFSELYKYLQFKSTTGETFQRHINIDCGYKYFDTASLLKSENALNTTDYPRAYWNYDGAGRDSAVEYKRYLDRIREFLIPQNPENAYLTEHEITVARQFYHMLQWKSKESGGQDFFDKKWDMCPLCELGNVARSMLEMGIRKSPEMASRDASSRGRSRGGDINIAIYPNLNPFLMSDDIEWSASGWIAETEASKLTKLKYHASYGSEGHQVDLSNVEFTKTPRYAIDPSLGIVYELAGYSTSKGSNDVVYATDAIIDQNNMPSGSLNLYAVWRPNKCVVTFDKGDLGHETTKTIPQMVVERGKKKLLPAQEWESETDNFNKQFTYYAYEDGVSTDFKWSTPTQEESPESIGSNMKLKKFVSWTCTTNNTLKPTYANREVLQIPDDFSGSPEIHLKATWSDASRAVKFYVTNHLYCTVLVDASANAIVYPKRNPRFVNSSEQFLGWNVASGYVMDLDKYAVVCEGTDTTIICGDDTDPIICTPPAGGSFTVEAFVHKIKGKNCTVTFRYFAQNEGNGTVSPISI